MGVVLKLSVCVLSFFLLLNVLYLSNYHFEPFRKGYLFNFFISEPAPEPLTIRGNHGRLGNQMFLLATLYGLALLNDRGMSLRPKNYEALVPYFDLNFPLTNLSTFRVKNPWMIGYWLKAVDYSIPRTSNIVSGNPYPTSYTFFDHVREDIRRIFRFRPPLQEHAENVLRHVKRIRPGTQVFVCVHVRRGDYLSRSAGGWLKAANGREVDVLYFRKALEHFRARYSNITFLAISDDRKWTRDHLSPLGILTLPPAESPGHDLAVLAACNHTVMTYGTFGFWGGYLAGGDVVYFTDFVKPGSKMSEIFVYDKMYPKQWTGISTTPDNFWKGYTNPFI